MRETIGGQQGAKMAIAAEIGSAVMKLCLKYGTEDFRRNLRLNSHTIMKPMGIEASKVLHSTYRKHLRAVFGNRAPSWASSSAIFPYSYVQ
jgi:hypothetical protein